MLFVLSHFKDIVILSPLIPLKFSLRPLTERLVFGGNILETDRQLRQSVLDPLQFVTQIPFLAISLQNLFNALAVIVRFALLQAFELFVDDTLLLVQLRLIHIIFLLNLINQAFLPTQFFNKLSNFAFHQG